MNRNIVTEDDIPGFRLEADTGRRPGARSPDDYWARLVKYVPVEIIGAYLVVLGVLDTAYPDSGTPRRIALATLAVLSLVASWLFAQRVLNVVRQAQLAMTAVAFAVWVFATGGYFSTTAWWEPWMGTIAVVAFGVAARIVGLGPLPSQAEQPAASPSG